MKKLTSKNTLICILVICMIILIACSGKSTGPSSQGLSAEEYAAVGTYELTAISGAPGVSVDMYDYCFIILSNDGKYLMMVKAGVNENKLEGNWSLRNEVLTFRTRIGNQTAVEEHTLRNYQITMRDLGITLVFTKVNDSED
jgi:hypothetical protein